MYIILSTFRDLSLGAKTFIKSKGGVVLTLQYYALIIKEHVILTLRHCHLIKQKYVNLESVVFAFKFCVLTFKNFCIKVKNSVLTIVQHGIKKLLHRLKIYMRLLVAYAIYLIKYPWVRGCAIYYSTVWWLRAVYIHRKKLKLTWDEVLRLIVIRLCKQWFIIRYPIVWIKVLLYHWNEIDQALLGLKTLWWYGPALCLFYRYFFRAIILIAHVADTFADLFHQVFYVHILNRFVLFVDYAKDLPIRYSSFVNCRKNRLLSYYIHNKEIALGIFLARSKHFHKKYPFLIKLVFSIIYWLVAPVLGSVYSLLVNWPKKGVFIVCLIITAYWYNVSEYGSLGYDLGRLVWALPIFILKGWISGESPIYSLAVDYGLSHSIDPNISFSYWIVFGGLLFPFFGHKILWEYGLWCEERGADLMSRPTYYNITDREIRLETLFDEQAYLLLFWVDNLMYIRWYMTFWELERMKKGFDWWFERYTHIYDNGRGLRITRFGNWDFPKARYGWIFFWGDNVKIIRRAGRYIKEIGRASCRERV